jgi:iron complex outermembrane receptor protein
MKPFAIQALFLFTFCMATDQLIYSQTSYSVRYIKKLFILNGTLSGKVIEKDKGVALPGATVYIPDLKLGVIADDKGQYRFNSLPSGAYLIQVHYVGFKTVTKNVIISGATVENFELTEYSIEESPVVVTGLSKATQIKRSPVPIVSVNHDYIATNLSTNIIDAIAKVPGVNALTTGPNVSKPFIRGLGYNRILTLFDGLRQEGQQWGDEHGIEVDQYGVERIEIIKGPASLTYGSDALAGVVNLIPTQPAAEGKLIGDVLAEYYTNNGMVGGSAMLGATKKGFEWMARVSHKQAANYQNKIDGRVYNTAFNESDAGVSFGLHRTWGYSHLSFSLFDDLQEIPDGSRDSATRKFTKQITEADTVRPIVSDAELKTYSIGVLHQHIQHYRVYANNNFIIGNGRLAVNLGYQKSVRREFSHPEASTTPGLFLQLNTYSYDLKYYFAEFSGWNLTAGLNGMYQDNNVTKGTSFVIPSFRQFDIGPFALVKKTIDKLDISGGVRFDSRSFKNDQLYKKPDPITGFDIAVSGADTVGADKPFSNFSHTFSGITGSIGATFNFTEKFSVKANLSRGFRAPNIAEISSNGVHPGTNSYQIGNTNFAPEFNIQEDIGAEYSSQYALITLSLFNNTISNYIFNQKVVNNSGADSIIVPGTQTFKFQQGKAQLYGGEISLDIHAVKGLHFENSLSVVYALNKGVDPKLQSDSNKYLPFIPPLHGISELRYVFDAKTSHIVNCFIKVQLAYYAAQNRVYLTDNTETPTTGYSLFNAGMGAGVTNSKGKKIFNLYVMGNNLFDVAYQDHLSRLKYFEQYSSSPNGHLGIYNIGRNIAFKLEFPLDFDTKKQ